MQNTRLSSRSKSFDPERLTRAGAFLLLSALFSFLLASNRIDLLIIHGHSWTIAAAAMFLAVLGLNELRGFITGRLRAHRHRPQQYAHRPDPQLRAQGAVPNHRLPCTCSDNHTAHNKLKWLFVNALIFMAPVFLSFSTTPAIFDASAAMHRGLKMNLLSANYPVGSAVELTGFVVRWNELPQNEIVVTRFAISCCVADAVPIGITVRWPEAASYPINSWVRVKGLVEQENRPTGGGNKPHIFIQAYSITPIEKPEQPYLYHDH